MSDSRRHFLKTAALGVGAATVSTQMSGCALLKEFLAAAFKQPKVKIVKMDILSMALDTVKTEFTANITNPNPFGVSLAGFGYGLAIEGARFASGDQRKGVDIKAQGKSLTKFPVDIALGKTADAILAMLEKDKVRYDIDTQWRFQIPKVKRQIELPATFGGELPMPKIPQFSVSKFEVSNIDVLGGRVGFRMQSRVRNTNAFDIPIDSFAFDVKLNNRSVLNNKRVSGLALPKGKTKTVPLEFSVGLLDLGVTAAEIVQNPRVNWGLRTDLKSGALTLPFNNTGTLRLSA